MYQVCGNAVKNLVIESNEYTFGILHAWAQVICPLFCSSCYTRTSHLPSYLQIPQCWIVTPFPGHGGNTNNKKLCIWTHHAFVCVRMCFKFWTSWQILMNVGYGRYSIEDTHSATHVNILQAVISNNMLDEQISVVGVTLAPLILGYQNDVR